MRGKIREIVRDPATAEMLAPRDIIGGKRLCADAGYFETFNEPHVKLVDISTTPLSRLTRNGLVVGEHEYELDDIVPDW